MGMVWRGWSHDEAAGAAPVHDTMVAEGRAPLEREDEMVRADGAEERDQSGKRPRRADAGSLIIIFGVDTAAREVDATVATACFCVAYFRADLPSTPRCALDLELALDL